MKLSLKQSLTVQQERQQQYILCASLGIGLLLAVLFGMATQSMSNFATTCADIRADTVRLHVQANSNSIQDQTLKLKVRDAVLGVMVELYQAESMAQQDDATTTDVHTSLSLRKQEAIGVVLGGMPRLSLAVAKVLADADSAQQANLYIVDMLFDTTDYQTFTLPAGEYTALRVELGTASGKNWWCVLYPSLCVSVATVQAQYEQPAENELIAGNYRIRFAIVSWWQSLKAWMFGDD